MTDHLSSIQRTPIHLSLSGNTPRPTPWGSIRETGKPEWGCWYQKSEADNTSCVRVWGTVPSEAHTAHWARENIRCLLGPHQWAAWLEGAFAELMNLSCLRSILAKHSFRAYRDLQQRPYYKLWQLSRQKTVVKLSQSKPECIALYPERVQLSLWNIE